MLARNAIRPTRPSTSRSKISGNPVLFATICNTVGEASPYALWFMRDGRQYFVDLSGHLDRAAGLTGIAYRDGRLYLTVRSHEPRILVLAMTLRVIDTITHESFNDLHAPHVIGDTLLVAGGPDRTMSRKNPEGDGARALRQVLDERPRLFEVTQGASVRLILPECPGYEIYELFALPAAAGLRPAEDRVIPADPGLFARYYYTSLITAHARASP